MSCIVYIQITESVHVHQIHTTTNFSGLSVRLLQTFRKGNRTVAPAVKIDALSSDMIYFFLIAVRLELRSNYCPLRVLSSIWENASYPQMYKQTAVLEGGPPSSWKLPLVCVRAVQIETVCGVEVSNNKTHEHACQITLIKYYPTATLYYVVDLY